jgi:diaminopimelate decarboxylase
LILNLSEKNRKLRNSDLLGIAENFGKPLYVYEGEKITSQYERLTSAFARVNNLRINYAAKALSNVSVLKFMRHLGAGLDTVSIQEVQLGLNAGFEPKSIIYTPNGVSLNEIENVAKLGVQINIDNLSLL